MPFQFDLSNISATAASLKPCVAPLERGLIFYGDPHGTWKLLLLACADAPPDAVILLGDLQLSLTLRQQIEPLFTAGISMLWIPGNHDTGSADAFDRLWGGHSDGNLHTRMVEIGGIRIAGLGSIFKDRVWYPRFAGKRPP